MTFTCVERAQRSAESGSSTAGRRKKTDVRRPSPTSFERTRGEKFDETRVDTTVRDSRSGDSMTRARASRGGRSLGQSTIGDDAINYKYFNPTIFARRWRVCWVTTAMRLMKASARTEGIFERNGATTASGAVKMSVIPSVRTLVAR